MRRLITWTFVGALLFLLALGGTFLVAGCTTFEVDASGERLQRMEHSPQWRDGSFRNAQLIWNNIPGALLRSFDFTSGEVPDQSPPVVITDGAYLKVPPRSGLRVTWFGHSSTLIEIDGLRVLTDPLWSARASPLAWVGPKRWYAPPIALDRLPQIDVVMISHDHYDHLDRGTIEAMRGWKAIFVVPLGVGAFLEAWGIAKNRIVELDWWQSTRIGSVELVATPARHASGRIWPQSDTTLWSSFALIGSEHRVWYSGDTGLFSALNKIGELYGPFDATLIEAGQYDADWPDWHLGPEQSVEANRMVRGKVMIPVHWGLFNLAHHRWTEPIERVLAVAKCTNTAVLTPRPGESIEPALRPLTVTPVWWPLIPWYTGAERPVIATRNGDPANRVAIFECGASAYR